MNLTEFFKKVVKTLQEQNIEYAVAGGLVASLYRQNERTTNDLDFLVLTADHTQETASSIIQQFGLTPHIIRQADLEKGPLFAIKRKTSIPFMIAGRGEKTKPGIGLDFILPSMPWFEEAMKRAQYNKIDFGFGSIPCLTKEDLILSKFYSLKNDPARFNDLDDLKSIFLAKHEIDLPYIGGQMQKLQLIVPESLKDFAPQPLLLTSKRIRRELRQKPKKIL